MYRAGGGLAHQGAAAGVPGWGQKGPGPGAGHQRRLVPGPRRVPQAGRLPDPQDAAPAEQPWPGGVQVGAGAHVRCAGTAAPVNERFIQLQSVAAKVEGVIERRQRAFIAVAGRGVGILLLGRLAPA